jgi:hypothetical protein
MDIGCWPDFGFISGDSGKIDSSKSNFLNKLQVLECGTQNGQRSMCRQCLRSLIFILIDWSACPEK